MSEVEEPQPVSYPVLSLCVSHTWTGYLPSAEDLDALRKKLAEKNAHEKREPTGRISFEVRMVVKQPSIAVDAKLGGLDLPEHVAGVIVR